MKHGKDYLFSVRNTKFVRINDNLLAQNLEATNDWRTLNLPEFQQVKYLQMASEKSGVIIIFQYSKVAPDIEALLNQPVQFSMLNGKISSVFVSSNEPLWSKNFKKAIIVNLQKSNHQVTSK